MRSRRSSRTFGGALAGEIQRGDSESSTRSVLPGLGVITATRLTIWLDIVRLFRWEKICA